MEIHELNTFSGTLGANDYFATDNGNDTSKVSAEAMLAPLNARIDNIITTPAPSAEEIVDARLGADGVTYPSLGDAIRGQVSDLKSELNVVADDLIELASSGIFEYDFVWEDGTLSGSTGGDSPSTTDERTGFINCSDIEGYSFKMGTSNKLEVYYYTSSKVFISPYVNKQADFIFATPENAVYVRFCTKKSTNVWSATKTSNLATKSDLSDLSDSIDEEFGMIIEKNFSKNRFDGDVVSGYVNQANGVWVDGHATYKGTAEMIDVLSSPFVLSVRPYSGTLNLGMRYAVYDADGTYISGAVVDTSDFSFATNPDDAGQTLGYLAFTNTNIRFIRFSMDGAYFATARVQIEQGSTPTNYTPYTGDTEEIVGTLQLNSSVIGNKGLKASSASLSSGATLMIDCDLSLRKNKLYHLHTLIDSSFDTLYFGHGESTYSLYIKIDNTNITFMTNGSEGTQLPHGLSLDTYIDFMLIVGEKNTGTIILNTRSGVYSHTVQVVNGYRGKVFVRPSNCSLTDVNISFSSIDFRQPIWMFGDSYFTHTSDARWTYWLIEWGFGRCLLNAFPGEESLEALPQVLNYIPINGSPKYLVWCLGMNDPDTETEVNADWKTAVETVIETCEKYGVTPILATIPNVPNYSNYFKNEYVKSSGYRYIDFAKAVGAESVGSSWYTGCLSQDNTHPTELGARLLCLQAIQDVSELTLGNV